MAKTNFKGNPVRLKGELPKINSTGEDFTYVKTDLSEESLYDIEDKVKVIIAVPSLDTGVCATETRKFNEKLAQKEDVIGLVVSKDLPFAMKRFCETDGIKNVVPASDFRYGDFLENYNTEMIEGPLKGLSARAIIVLDQDNVVKYVELVPEVTQEPDYDKAMSVVESLI